MLELLIIVLKNLVFILVLTLLNNLCFVLFAKYRKHRLDKKQILKKQEKEILELLKENQKLTEQLNKVYYNQDGNNLKILNNDDFERTNDNSNQPDLNTLNPAF